MSRMTIRLKIALWYTLLTVCLLAVFLPVLYGLISQSMYFNQEGILRTAASQAILGCEIENDILVWNSETKLPAGIAVAIVDENGKVIINNNNSDWMVAGPYKTGEIAKVNHQNTSWMVYNESIKNENQVLAYVRVSVSLEAVNTSLNNVKILMLIAAPAFLLVAIFGGLLIARKALRPISKITDTASTIEKGDLSTRITGIKTNDEVGHLSETFNSMLEHLETSFNRERQFSSDASHELRTPVSIIMAYTEALLAKFHSKKVFDEDEQIRSLELILSESQKMNIIISQLLMLARGSEGKYKKEIERIDLNEIIGSVVEQLQEQALAGDISLFYEPSDGLDLMADQSLITQMLINLIVNSIKYGKSGGFVRITAKKEFDGLHIVIEDDGVGISSTDLPYIFDRFYRADQSRDRSGTGLGLSIVKWIVGEHNGKIEVESAPEVGTTFTIVI